MSKIRNKRQRILKIWLPLTLGIIVITSFLVGGPWDWFKYFNNPSAPSAETIEFDVAFSGTDYEESIDSGKYVVQAATPYLQALRRSARVDGTELLQLISADQAKPTKERSPLPLATFAITNNSSDTILIDQVALRVRRSTLDLEPLVWSSATRPHTNIVLNGSFILGNYGWGNASDVKFSFDIVAAGQEVLDNKTPPFSVSIADVLAGGTVDVPLWDALSKYGVDIYPLRREDISPAVPPNDPRRSTFDETVIQLKSAIGAAPHQNIVAVGRLNYKWDNGKQVGVDLRQEIQFQWPVWPVAPAIFAAVEYDLRLHESGADYTEKKAIFHYVKPRDVEAIGVRIYCEKSSVHEFTAFVHVKKENLWLKAHDNFKLHCYRPQHAAWRTMD